MTEQRKNEILHKVFYKCVDNIMHDLEGCEDSHIIFQIGLNVGILHHDLDEELSAELTKEED